MNYFDGSPTQKWVKHFYHQHKNELNTFKTDCFQIIWITIYASNYLMQNIKSLRITNTSNDLIVFNQAHWIRTIRSSFKDLLKNLIIKMLSKISHVK
jgi:hypothetical protein